MCWLNPKIKAPGFSDLVSLHLLCTPPPSQKSPAQSISPGFGHFQWTATQSWEVLRVVGRGGARGPGFKHALERVSVLRLLCPTPQHRLRGWCAVFPPEMTAGEGKEKRNKKDCGQAGRKPLSHQDRFGGSSNREDSAPSTIYYWAGHGFTKIQESEGWPVFPSIAFAYWQQLSKFLGWRVSQHLPLKRLQLLMSGIKTEIFWI